MSTKTRIQLVNKALSIMLVVGAGQTANAEDYQKVDDMVEAVVDDLAEREVFLVDDLDEIAGSAFRWVAICLAESCAEDFGKESNPVKQEYAEQQLKDLASAGPEYTPLVTEYF